MDRQMPALAFVFFAFVSHEALADRTLHTLTLTVPLQNPATSECPMIASDGNITMQYTTAARETNTFIFSDPLAPQAILLDMFVSIPTTGSCQPSKHLNVSLNPGLPNLIPGISTIGTIDPQGTVSCPTPQPVFTNETIGNPGQLIYSEVSPYLRASMNILQVVESGSGCGDVRIERVTVTLRYYIDLPVIMFDLTNRSPEDERKVLMHKWRDDYDYLAEAQRSVTPINNRDHNVLVRGTAFDSTAAPLANDTVYVRTADPPDPSPYLPSGTSHDGDNPYGWSNIVPSDFYGWSPVSTDGNGRFQVVMPMTPRFAGDNQELEACGVALPYLALPRRCTAALGCYASGTFTAWRRVYLEVDHMFRQGSFLRADVVAGDTRVPVFERSPFTSASQRNPLSVILIHAPDLNVADPTGLFYSETRNVIRVTGGRHHPVLELDRPLDHAYVQRQSTVDSALPAGDSIGVFQGNADLFPAYLDLAVSLMLQTYTDYKVLQDGTENRMPYIPYVAGCPSNPSGNDYCSEVASMWFDSRRGGSGFLDNHSHLVVASQALAGSPPSPDLSEAGVTNLGRNDVRKTFGLAPVVFIWNTTIASGFPSSAVVVATREITAHELVHTFDVNQPVRITGGHCQSDAWDGGHCLMNPNRSDTERIDGIVSLHNDPWLTSEYRRIRRSLDPLPFFDQADFNPNP